MAVDDGTQTALDEVLDGGIRAVYQPIVDLETGDTVAFEALARGPVGSALESPAALFAAAADADDDAQLTVRLDHACRAAAVGGALEADLAGPISLFVNVEPAAVGTTNPPHLDDILRRADGRLHLVVELTERALADDPAGLLATVAGLRADGWRIALDDVGAEPSSLALMPFLFPDVVKLDLRLIQRRTNAEIAAVVNAVRAESERTGAVILAEGIESEEHRLRALTMGASFGQGWLFGRPGPLPPGAGPAVFPFVAERARPTTHGRSPFEAVAEVRSTRRSTVDLLLPMSLYLERQAAEGLEPPILLSTFQHAANFPPNMARRYSRMADALPLVGAFGAGTPVEPAPGVRWVELSPDDSLVHEWVVAVVGPHFAGALVARDLGDDGGDDRQFDYVVTFDRDLAVAVARSLLERLVGAH